MAHPKTNKQKFWRRMSVKQYDGNTERRTGRQLREAIRGMNHQGILTALHLWLFKSAGIDTPVYDAQMKAMRTVSPKSDEIQDVEILSQEGVPSAA